MFRVKLVEHMTHDDHIHTTEKSLLKISAFYIEQDSYLKMDHLRLVIPHIAIPT